MTAKEKAKELVGKLSALQLKIEWGNSKLKIEAGLIYEKNNIEYNNYYDEPGYEDWAGKPEIAVAVSGDYGATWSSRVEIFEHQDDVDKALNLPVRQCLASGFIVIENLIFNNDFRIPKVFFKINNLIIHHYNSISVDRRHNFHGIIFEPRN